MNELIDYLFEDVSHYSFGIYIEDINPSILKKKLIKNELMKKASLGVKVVDFDIDTYGFEGNFEILKFIFVYL